MVILRTFTGFETGGLEEAYATTGSPSVQSVVVRTGNYALKMSSDSDNFVVHDSGSFNQTTHWLFGFAFLTPDATPAVIRTIASMEGDSTTKLTLSLLTDGKLRLNNPGTGLNYDSTNSIDEGEWNYIEVYFYEADVGGEFRVWLNDVQEIVQTSIDTRAESSVAKRLIIYGATEIFYYDDVYFNINTNEYATYRYGPRTEVLGAFQNTVEDATDQGDTLNVGVWADAGNTPGSTPATIPAYTSDPLSGYVGCDEGDRSGPLALITGTVKGGKWVLYLDLSGTKEAEIVVGKYNGSSYSTKGVAITEVRNESYYFHVDESATYVPSANTHYFCQGGSTIGGVDVGFIDMWSFLLHVAPDPATLDLSDMDFPDQNYYLGPFGT